MLGEGEMFNGEAQGWVGSGLHGGIYSPVV